MLLRSRDKRRRIGTVLANLNSYGAYNNVLSYIYNMSFYNDRDYRPQGSGVAWKRGMPLGEGKKHDSYMTGRIDASRLYSVDGTVQNPKVSLYHIIATQLNFAFH